MGAEETVLLALPADQSRWAPDPFPGSPEAAEAGCVCPIEQPWPGQLRLATDCPVHELKAVRQ